MKLLLEDYIMKKWLLRKNHLECKYLMEWSECRPHDLVCEILGGTYLNLGLVVFECEYVQE